MLTWLFYMPIALLAYQFILFPVILLVSARRKGEPYYGDMPDDQLPTITMIIAARNEADVIADKLANSVALDYPKDKYSVIVAANGCTDDTPKVVRSFSDQGVFLAEYGNVGKTEAQRRAVREHAKGEILVFSDANTPFDNDALRELVQPFQDPKVGSVAGNHIYLDKGDSRSATEGFFWNSIELFYKKTESASGGALGAMGSIYAVRRSLFVDLPPDVYEDFWQPMLIAVKGYRTVFAPNAICREQVEEPDLEIEHRRKMRIVQQSVAGIIKFRWVLNPFRYPRLAWLTISHKILRWGAPFMLLAMLVSATFKLLLGRSDALQRFFFFSTTILGFLAILGRGLGRYKSVPILTHSYYAVLMLHAAYQGTLDGFKLGSFSSWDRVR
ncbi:glycosyltransferase family 2 protein [bacterium]|nr:glycosyltransferase family 2 protein [bacterium]